MASNTSATRPSAAEAAALLTVTVFSSAEIVDDGSSIDKSVSAACAGEGNGTPNEDSSTALAPNNPSAPKRNFFRRDWLGDRNVNMCLQYLGTVEQAPR